MIDHNIFEDLQAKIDEEAAVRDVSWPVPAPSAETKPKAKRRCVNKMYRSFTILCRRLLERVLTYLPIPIWILRIGIISIWDSSTDY